MSGTDDRPPLSSRVYWWVAAIAIVEMLLLYWLTQAFDVPLPGGS